MKFSAKDTQRLYRLAEEQQEIANGEKMAALLKEWARHGRFEKNARPMVTVEMPSFAGDILPPLLQCEEEAARELEASLLANMVNHTLFADDTIVPPFFPFEYEAQFTPFNLPVQVEYIEPGNRSLGHHFKEQLKDLEKDYHKLQPSTFHLVPKAETLQKMQEYNDFLGHILPGKVVYKSIYCTPCQDIVHLMSMENMFLSMCDHPELFLQMMDSLASDYIRYFRALEEDGRLGETTGMQRVNQGSYAFTEQLPKGLAHYVSRDVWGYMDSQESTGLSPDMYAELVFPSYQKIMAEFGRVSYGCCEAVDPIWENCLSIIPHLG